MLSSSFQIKRVLLAHDKQNPGITRPLLKALQDALKNRGLETDLLAPDTVVASREDLLVVLGGDGFLLHTLKCMDYPDVPVFGLNFGQVGFLMNPRQCLDDLPGLIQEGQFNSVELPIMSAHASGGDMADDVFLAVNDFVLERESGQTIRFDIYIDGVLLNRYSGDGMIIATSAGSTAYTLAAGGPVVHPDLHALVVTPVNAHRPVQFHSLQFPLVLPLASRIEVKVLDAHLRPTYLVADGVRVGRPDRVLMQAGGRSMFLLRTGDYTYPGDLLDKVIGNKSGR